MNCKKKEPFLLVLKVKGHHAKTNHENNFQFHMGWDALIESPTT